MPRPFPAQPSLEHFRKQAKQLLRDVRANASDAVARARRMHPLRRAGADLSRGFSLHDAQLVVAREFGFASWRRLQDAARRESASQDDGRRALVTGGAGFIGSHLAENLLARGFQVVLLDNLSGGARDNVAHLLHDSRVILVEGDVCDAGVVDPLVADADVVFHLAAVMGYQPGPDPVDLWRTNVDGTQVVIDAASRHGVRFVLASTSMVYGKTEGRETLKEDADLIMGSDGLPGWDYAMSKIANEQLTRAHSECHGLQSTIVRLFNVVGPRAMGTVVPAFVGQARGHQPLTVHGDGTQRRCFTDVRDAAEGMVRLADCPDACGQTVNIGSRNDYTVLQLADLIRTISHSPSTVELVPFEDMPLAGFQRHIPWKTPCLSKARKLVGYAPSHGIEECLHEVVALGGAPSGPVV